MNEKLKPCPFCGGRAVKWIWNGGTRIDCENWAVTDKVTHFVGVGAKTEEEAIRLWNDRKEEDERLY